MEQLFSGLLELLGMSGNAAVTIIFALLFLVFGFVCLVKGSDWFVDGAVGIADRFGIPQIVIGLTIVAMGTSAPEAAVSISGAFAGAADITIGNIVGSNILNVLIILGLSAVVCPLVVDKSTAFIDTPFMISISVLLLLLGLDGKITFIDALIMVVVFVSYMAYLLISALKNKSVSEDEDFKKRPIWLTLIMTVFGLGIVILGSQFAVTGATVVAESIGVSERFIGLTVVALGTSLPELFTSVSAARKGNADIAIGNIVGSNIFNILFVVGLSGLITTVPFASKFIIDMLVAIASSVLLFVCCAKNKKLSRLSGAIMLVCYAGYFAYLVLA